jgi:EAL domain-containing protein (putative c-di-GMP-specific phosphodiesterase class I)
VGRTGYLLSFPFSTIKIDRSFIAGLPDKTESRAIVRAIADLARNLNMKVVAEGIETTEQREQAQTLGCTDIQGYLISVPRTAEELHQLFLSHVEDTDKRRFRKRRSARNSPVAQNVA